MTLSVLNERNFTWLAIHPGPIESSQAVISDQCLSNQRLCHRSLHDTSLLLNPRFWKPLITHIQCFIRSTPTLLQQNNGMKVWLELIFSSNYTILSPTRKNIGQSDPHQFCRGFSPYCKPGSGDFYIHACPVGTNLVGRGGVEGWDKPDLLCFEESYVCVYKI